MNSNALTLETIVFAANRVFCREVVPLDRNKWQESVRPDGSPTLFIMPPEPIDRVAETVPVILSAGSGICNADPGVDVVRLDEKDDPDIFNIDHYRVIEDLTTDWKYTEILRTANVQGSPEIDSLIRDYVFLVKNRANETKDHHSSVFPERIEISQIKTSNKETGAK